MCKIGMFHTPRIVTVVVVVVIVAVAVAVSVVVVVIIVAVAVSVVAVAAAATVERRLEGIVEQAQGRCRRSITKVLKENV